MSWVARTRSAPSPLKTNNLLTDLLAITAFLAQLSRITLLYLEMTRAEEAASTARATKISFRTIYLIARPRKPVIRRSRLSSAARVKTVLRRHSPFSVMLFSPVTRTGSNQPRETTLVSSVHCLPCPVVQVGRRPEVRGKYVRR